MYISYSQIHLVLATMSENYTVKAQKHTTEAFCYCSKKEFTHSSMAIAVEKKS